MSDIRLQSQTHNSFSLYGDSLNFSNCRGGDYQATHAKHRDLYLNSKISSSFIKAVRAEWTQAQQTPLTLRSGAGSCCHRGFTSNLLVKCKSPYGNWAAAS